MKEKEIKMRKYRTHSRRYRRARNDCFRTRREEQVKYKRNLTGKSKDHIYTISSDH